MDENMEQMQQAKKPLMLSIVEQPQHIMHEFYVNNNSLI